MDPERRLAQLLCQYQDIPGGVLPLLQAVQEDFGYIPGEAVPGIAGVMNLKAIPHPVWFWVACIVVFLWTGWFGAQTGCALRPKAK